MFVVLFAISTGVINSSIKPCLVLTTLSPSGALHFCNPISAVVDVPYHSSGWLWGGARLDRAVLVELRCDESHSLSNPVSTTFAFLVVRQY